ncbi:MAG TPA: protein kinase [Vicinamibacterales bacterium]|nr:protein kinase [Vicinamibacterales bacterium]
MTPERWHAITEIFHGAIARAAQDRETYLAVAYEADPSLRADVEAMIAAHENGSGFGNAPIAAAADLELAPGTRLGAYRIESLIAAGGMGEVYRARDTRLDRTVAIKILPPQLRQLPELQARFEREARLVSQLAHPNICTLHDIGREGAVDFLVMEYVDGESLAARIENGRVPLNQALQIGIDIAAALAHAHRQGIVHRDLKPSNVLLTRTGAKLLDFGIAKTHAGMSPRPSDLSLTMDNPPYLAHEATQLTATGAIIGTVQYMAPEQVEGRVADARTDIFALGAVIYETVTGRKAFPGQTQGSIIGSILRDDPPPISSIQELAPPALDFVLHKCVAKDPDDRWQSAQDVMSQFEWIARGNGSQLAAAPAAGRLTTIWRRETLAWTLAGILTILSATAVGVYVKSPSAARQPDVRFEIPTPHASGFSLSISPDGRQVVYVARAPDRNEEVLWLRPLAATQAQPLPGTDAASGPFWSPDSQNIGFGARGTIKRVDMAGGLPRTVCEVPGGDYFGGTWNRNNAIVFSSGLALLRVAADGGQPTPITTLDRSRGEAAHRYPAFLPDGRHFIYSILSTDPATAGVYVGAPDLSDRKRVLDAVSVGGYVEPGYLIYHKAGALMAQPFDTTGLSVEGTAVRIAESVAVPFVTAVHRFAGLAAFAVSASGPIIYRDGQPGNASARLQWFDRTGKPLDEIGQPAVFWGMALSPDEKHVAVTRQDPQQGRDVWTVDLSTGVPTRVTVDPANEDDAAWSAKGRALTYWSDRSGKFGIYETTLGSSAERVVYQSQTPIYLGNWSRDGRYLLAHNVHSVLAFSNVGPAEPLRRIDSPASKDEPHFSPDGKWVAYSSDESGIPEVYVASFPEFEKRRAISLGGGGVPWWRGDGRELFYMSRDGKLMSVLVNPESADFGVPTMLFQTPIESPSLITARYVVTGDGQKFLLAVPAGTVSPITVVLDWTRLLPH